MVVEEDGFITAAGWVNGAATLLGVSSGGATAGSLGSSPE